MSKEEMVWCSKCGHHNPWYKTYCSQCKAPVIRGDKKVKEDELLTICENCKKQLSKRASQCPHCGFVKKETCNVCANKISFDSTSCPKCGDPKPFDKGKIIENNIRVQKKPTPEFELKPPIVTENRKEPEKVQKVKSQNPYLRAFERAIDFQGRSNRKEYWTFSLINLSICILLFIIADNIFFLEDIVSVMFVIFLLINFIPAVSLMVRRFHDIGKSGWFFLITIIPILGNILFIVLMLSEGDREENKYGVPFD